MLVSFAFSWLPGWLSIILKTLQEFLNIQSWQGDGARRNICPCMEGTLKCAGAELFCWCKKSISVSSVPRHKVERCCSAADAQACVQQDISSTPCTSVRSFREHLLPSSLDGKTASESWGFYCAPNPGIRVLNEPYSVGLKDVWDEQGPVARWEHWRWALPGLQTGGETATASEPFPAWCQKERQEFFKPHSSLEFLFRQLMSSLH